jgi:PAS domain S-box-containing protein
VLDADLSYALPAAKALAEAAVGVTLADVSQPDAPLVYINSAFTKLTGYTEEQALGRNCRFLQGPGTDPVAVARLREAVAQRREVRVTLLNYRADGTPFHNELLMAPVHDDDGQVTHIVGMQLDVTHSMQAALRLRDERDQLASEVAELGALRDVLSPRELPEVPGLELAARHLAAAQVAGDFILVTRAADGTTIIAVGDAIGHGTVAAQQASFVRASLATFAAHTSSPDRLLELANASLIERTASSGSFATCACLAVGPEGDVRTALAGHPNPVALDTGEQIAVERRGPPLGVALDFSVPCTKTALAPGEGLLLHTDGLTEARLVPSGTERVGDERVAATLRGHAGAPPEEIVQALTALTPEMAEGHPADDVCVIALRRR